ncbi:2,3-diaminopropionate biosynthesis protein SbnA [Sediminicola luteus]|uniref:2,3-diaminopropionate biosynthesis protein SbnA n=1 Tax=Sediminicola luteus TaxID=319238 RepID=A0ABV2TTP0_9FLAO
MITLESTSSISPNIVSTIGDTPLVRLDNLFESTSINLFGKLEAANPSGSLKDRTATYIIKQAMESGKIKKGDTVIESSSGNMALGLAQACIFYGLHLVVVVDPKLNSHTEKLLITYGATIEYVRKPKLEGGFLAARLERVKQLLQEIPNSFWTNQYANPNNPMAHYKTMEEIMSALEAKVDYLFVATSTCGTIMGCADYILNNGLSTKVVAVDAEGSVLFGGRQKKRLIPGHGAGVPSNFLNVDKIWDHVAVTDIDCIKGCWLLLKKEGILCGGSTGGVVSAIEEYMKKIPQNSNCVFLLSDRGERYLDTIYDKKWLLKELPECKVAFEPINGW